MPSSTIDLSGKRFGRLTVLHRGEDAIRKNGRHSSTFVCQCDCGNVVQVRAACLKSGNTQSCGCLQKEAVGNLRKSHGLSNSRLYRIWSQMKQRCEDENNRAYKYYGGKGVTVCDEWNDFSVFAQWALESGYDDTLTIDRVENSVGYEPKNCRWVTMLAQNNNKTDNHLLTYNGKTQNITQWANEVGICRATISRRIHLGWSVEEALTLPVIKGRKRKK